MNTTQATLKTMQIYKIIFAIQSLFLRFYNLVQWYQKLKIKKGVIKKNKTIAKKRLSKLEKIKPSDIIASITLHLHFAIVDVDTKKIFGKSKYFGPFDFEKSDEHGQKNDPI